MEGSVDNLYFPSLFLNELWAEQLRLNHGPVFVVDFLVNHNQGASLDGLFLGDSFNFCNGIYFVDNALIVGLNNLGTVVPVGLVAVVLGRIVGSGNYNTSVAAQSSDGIGKLWGGAQAGEQVGFEAIGGKDTGSGLSENVGEPSGIVGYNGRKLSCLGLFGIGLDEVVCQALGGIVDNPGVHAVCSTTDNASQPTSTEFQILVEAVF